MNRLTFLSFFTIFFCLGIGIANFWHIPYVLLYAFAWMLAIPTFIFIKRQNSVWLLLILGIFLGALFLRNSCILAYSHIRHFTFYKSEPVIIKGKVIDYPRITPSFTPLETIGQRGKSKVSLTGFTTFILSAEELTWADKVYQVCGRIQVKVFRKERVSYADRVELKGRLFRPYRGGNNSFSYCRGLESQGIYSILTVDKDSLLKYLGKGRANPFKEIAYKVREKSRDILFRHLPFTQAGIFSAIILGDRSQILPHFQRLFVQTGTAHILAISGLHIGIFVFVLALILKALGIKRCIRYIIIVVALIFYCFLTGARSPVMRATFMAMIVILSFFLKREVRISHSLALAGLIILILNPKQLFNIGFQLSFISVISIVYLSPVIKRLFDAERFLIPAFSVSLAAWLGTLPFIAYYFKIVSPVTVLANIVVVPYLFLVIALGFSLLIIGMFFPALIPIFAGPANLSIVTLIWITKFFSHIPWAYFYL